MTFHLDQLTFLQVNLTHFYLNFCYTYTKKKEVIAINLLNPLAEENHYA